ncbi:ketoacyl-ACP synthase III family protein [Streptomyces sp. NPDC089799]|uniref:ketoacyl-ACP synthase III family protein n=1 Tax=Streptomyces sp. NPDC089799 TaxID=3155066 RepID=UPI00342EA5E8
MKWDDILIRSTGRWLPKATATSDAVARGLIKQRRADQLGSSFTTTSTEQLAVRMAARAAVDALTNAAAEPEELSLLLYTTVGLQAHSTPAQYLQRVLAATDAECYELRAASNGGMAGLLAAAGHLSARPDGEALVTGASIFPPEHLDRWQGSPGMIMADGGGALLMSRRSGFARLCTTAHTAVPELEEISRELTQTDDDQWTAKRRKFLSDTGQQPHEHLIWKALDRSLKAVVAEADLDPKEVKHTIVPSSAWEMNDFYFAEPLGLTRERTTWYYARQTGHVGPADQFLGLDHLIRERRLQPGDHVLMIGLGGGYCMTHALIQILEPPVPRNRIHFDR